MEIFKCYVPRSEFKETKQLIEKLTLILNAKTPNISKDTTRRYIAKIVRERYKEWHGMRSVKDIILEMYNKNKRK